MKRRAIHKLFLFALIAATAIGVSGARARTGLPRALAILSGESPAYREHLEGFKTVFKGEVTVAVLDADTARLAAALAGSQYDLVFAVGTAAAEFASRASHGLPVLFSMVYYPERHGLLGKENVAGISLRVPPEKTIEALQTVMPPGKAAPRFGVLYSQEAADEVEQLKSALAGRGFALSARRVESSGEVGSELNALLGEARVIWLLADPVVLPDADYLDFIIKKALDKKAAVVGVSDAHVRKGALLCVSVDYRLEGETAGKLALRIIGGAQPSSIGVLPPQNLIWSLNEQVAKELGWPVSAMTRKRFEKVHP